MKSDKAVRRLMLLATVMVGNLVLFNNCAKFHSGSAQLAVNEISISAVDDAGAGKILYQKKCSVCHGPIESSAKLGRSASVIRNALNFIPKMAPLQVLTDGEVAQIAAALALKLTATGGANPFTCAAGADPGVRDLRRLSRREYLMTLQGLMDGFATLDVIKDQVDSLPADVVSNIFDVEDVSVSADHVQAFLAISSEVAQALTGQPAWLKSVLNCPYDSQGMSDACWNGFFNSFAARAWRRPLTSAEQTDMKSLYQDQAGGDVATGLQAVVMTLLQSPNFLYQVEVNGVAHNGRTDLLELTDFEIAARLAFLATGRGPDAQLMADAANGVLQTAAGFSAEVARLFASTSAHDTVSDFYTQWLGANHMPASTHSDWFLGTIPRAQIQPEALKEIQDMTADLTWNRKGSYRDLLGDSTSYVQGPALATAYGAATSSSTQATGASSQTLVANQMTASVGRAEGTSWNLFSNGTLSQNLVLTADQLTTVVVRAHASLAQNVGANMVVHYGGQIIGTVTVNATTDMDYSFSFTPSAASALFSIEFTNDVYDPATQADRNLYVTQTVVSTLGSSASGVVAATMTSSGSAALLPADQRPGILSRMAMLVAGTNQTRLVHRGLLVRNNLLCDRISPPTIAPGEQALFMPPQPDPTASFRQQIETRTSSARCQACHSQLNPMGFVLENYDALARYRTDESVFDANGNILAKHPIDATVSPNIESTTEAPITGLKQMSSAIAASSKGPACAAQQWFTYSSGREPATSDSCTLKLMYTALMSASTVSASGDAPATLLNMLKAPVYDPNFRLRKVGP